MREVPGLNHDVDNFLCLSWKLLWCTDFGMRCILTEVPRSTQPSTLWGMVNEHQPHGQAIIHGDGLMFGKWQPTGGLTGLLCSLAYELAATWFWPTFTQRAQSELSHIASHHHSLYSSTSCCISDWPCQWKMAIFDPLQLPRPLNRFCMKLEIYNYLPEATSHAKFQGAMSTWVVWANSQFDAWKFLFFLLLHQGHRSHLLTHTRAQYIIIRRSGQGSAFWGIEWWNLKVDPVYSSKM